MQKSDQTWTKGNLALRNNAEHNVPVRVFRGYNTKEEVGVLWGVVDEGAVGCAVLAAADLVVWVGGGEV